MNRDFTLDREPLPVPVATREILGGGGFKLHAREWGNPEGYPLLFIHGWSQSDLCWLKQVRGELADTSRMVTFDLRGHGLSEKPPGPEHYADGQLWADDLAAVIDQSGLEQPVLVSWSYGGYVVADYLRAYGDAHIGGINLAGSATILRPPAFDHIGPGLLENAQDMCVPDLFANIAATRRFLRACTSRPLGDDELAAALAWNMVVPPAIRGALLSRELDSSDVLARTSVPVLVSHGRDDMIVLPSMAEHTLTACPAASVSWYDGVGHMPFWEAPDRFDRELADLAHAARSPQPVRSGSLGRPRPHRTCTDGRSCFNPSWLIQCATYAGLRGRGLMKGFAGRCRAVSRCSLVAVAAAGLLLPERFSRCRPQPGYRSGCDQG